MKCSRYTCVMMLRVSHTHDVIGALALRIDHIVLVLDTFV